MAMTAEIAILNREAVALAADSAVTMLGPSGEKIFTSANKLFTLSKYNPVAVMIYGNALFMEVPWETIIKIYRKRLRNKSFSSIKEYAQDFISFLTSVEGIFTEKNQKVYFERAVYSYLDFLKENIRNSVKKELEKRALSDEDIQEIVEEVIREQILLWERAEESLDIPTNYHKKILESYKNDMERAIKEVLEKLPLGKSTLKDIKNILASLFYKFPQDLEYSGTSGIVIAGFGESEVFPSLIAYRMDGILGGQLKYKIDADHRITIDTNAIIIPFAQREMVHLFLEGVDRTYLHVELNYVRELLKEFLELSKTWDKIGGLSSKKQEDIVNDILADFEEKLSRYRGERYTRPIMDVVASLPKSELALMAETLVNLTSLKRKWSTERETVGGPIDVALISKGDGFVWIKRKHYFDLELNPFFVEKYFKGVE